MPGSKAWWNGWATRRGRRFFGNRRRVRDAILEDADTLNEETVPDDDGFLDFVNALNEDGMDEDEEDMTDFAALPNNLGGECCWWCLCGLCRQRGDQRRPLHLCLMSSNG